MKTELTPDQINVAIAELCGWKKMPPEKRENKWGEDEWQKEGEYTPEGWSGHYRRDLPDYHGDLNAMAQAEATLTAPEQEQYATIIYSLVVGGYGLDRGCVYEDGLCNCITAPAAQRARAFLAVKGRA